LGRIEDGGESSSGLARPIEAYRWEIKRETPIRFSKYKKRKRGNNKGLYARVEESLATILSYLLKREKGNSRATENRKTIATSLIEQGFSSS